MAFGRAKSSRDALVERLHEYLRAGIEYLEPADNPTSSSIEIAGIVAALDRQADAGSAAEAETVTPEALDEPEPEDREQIERLRALEKQIQEAELAIRERDQSIEVLQVKLLNSEETGFEESAADTAQKVEKPDDTQGNRKSKPNTGAVPAEASSSDARAAVILAELEDSRKDIENRLANPDKLSKTHIAQLKQDLAMIRRTRSEITERLRLQRQRDAG